jgi:hypothetical protein
MIKDKKMFKEMLMKKVGHGLLLCCVSLFSTVSQGAVIASFDTQVNVDVSSTFGTSEFETALWFNDVYTEGSASGDASGTGDGGPVTLVSGESGTISAAASGEVTGDGSYVDSAWITDGYLLIDNEFGVNPITGDITFDISLSSNILTNSLNSDAFAGAYIYIENFFLGVVFDEFIEFDSFLEGPGTFGLDETFTFEVTDLTIAAGEYEEYYIAIDTIGFAEVREPDGIFLTGLVLLLAVRIRRTSLKPMLTRCI